MSGTLWDELPRAEAPEDGWGAIPRAHAGEAAPLAPAETIGLGDYGRALWSGTLGLGAAGASVLEWMSGERGAENFGAIRQTLQDEAEYQQRRMTPAGQQAIGASFLPGEGETSVLENPDASIGLKLTATLPSIVASIIPGALVARGLVAAGVGTGAVRAGTGATVGATNFGLSAGEVFGSIAQEVENSADADLMESSATYRMLRDGGLEEAEAKRRLISEAAAYKPLYAGLISAVAGGAIEGRLISDLATGAVSGAARGAARGALAEGTEEAIQTTAEETATAFGIEEATGEAPDFQKILARVIEGGVLGGMLGGAMGGAAGAVRPQRAGETPEVTEPEIGETEEAPAPATTPGTGPNPTNNIADEDQITALGSRPSPAPSPPAPQAAPVTPAPTTATEPGAAGMQYGPVARPNDVPFDQPPAPIAPLAQSVPSAVEPVSAPTSDPPSGPEQPSAPMAPTTQDASESPAVPPTMAPQVLAAAPVTPEVTPVSTPSVPSAPAEAPLSGVQQAALDRVEDRVRGVAKAERVPSGLLDEIINDIRADLAAEIRVRPRTEGASEIAQAVVEKLNIAQLIRDKVAERQARDAEGETREQEATERALLEAQAAAKARQVGRSAERSRGEKIAGPRQEEDWRTTVTRARKVLEREGDKAAQPYKDIVAYADSQTRGGNNKARAAAQARLRDAERAWVESQTAETAQQQAAEQAKEATKVTFGVILDRNLPPEGREKAADFTERMRRVVAEAETAGLADPFLNRIRNALSKIEAGSSLKYGDVQRLQADEFKARRGAEMQALEAETRKLEADVRAPKARFREGSDADEQAQADAAEYGDGRALYARRADGTTEVRRYGMGEMANDFHADGSATLRDMEGGEIKVPAKRVIDVRRALDATDAVGPGDGMLRQKIRQMIPDVPVVILNRAQMTQFGGGDDVHAMYFKPDLRERAEGGTGFIALNAEADEDSLSMFFHHEAIHAMTAHALDQNRELRDRMTKLARHVGTVMRGAKPDGVHQSQWDQMLYYTSNRHELAAGAMTDPLFQEILSTIEVTPKLAADLGLEQRGPISLWDAFLTLLRKAFGLPRGAMTALDAAVRLTGQAMPSLSKQQAEAARLVGKRGDDSSDEHILLMRGVGTRAKAIQDAAPDLVAGAKAAARQVGLGFMTQRQIVEAFGKAFAWSQDNRQGARADNPLVQVQRAIQQRGVKAHQLREQAEPLIGRMSRLTKEKPQVAAELGEIMVATTMSGVDPTVPLTHKSNKHVAGKGISTRQARAQHPKLEARWNALKRRAPEVEDIWNESRDYFTRQHREMSRLLVKNLLENRQIVLERQARDKGQSYAAKSDAELDAMAQRWLDKKTTDDDAKWVGDSYGEHIKRVRNLARTRGPYFPLRRFGDFVLTWEEGTPEEQVFHSRADAEAFIDGTDLSVLSIQRRYYDDQGNRLKAGDLKDPQVSAAREEFVVRVQNKGVEFFDSYREMAARRKELQGQKGIRVSDEDRRRDDPRVAMDLLPEQMRALVGATRRLGLTEERQRDTERAIEQAALHLLPGTSARSSLIQRRKVMGASTDMLRASANYANASANFLAKLEYGPQIHHGLDAMADYVDENRFDGSGETIRRREVLREMRLRNTTDALDISGGSSNRVMRVLQSLTFLNYLASPAYTLINLMQPWLVGAPYLSARYGAAKTGRAMAEATNLVGGRGLLTRGVTQSARHLREFVTGKEADRTDFLAMVRHEIQLSNARDKGEMVAMLDELAGEGLIDLSAGMELGRAMRGEGWAGSKLRQAEDFARALPSAAEVLNRTVMGIAAYRLARQAGKSAAQATDLAREAVANTQFDYTAANTARFMDGRRHPLLAPAFTFRKYAQGMYWLLGRQVHQAFKGASAAERKAARRTLAGVLLSHVVMAGALGLPTEPIKVALGVAAFALGEEEPWDWEREIRQGLADALGPEAAEIVTRGLPRAIGLDLSNRVGLDSLMFAKDLRDFSREQMQQYTVELLVGAPGAMLFNVPAGMQAMREGNVMRAAESLIPLKAFRDITKAMRYGDEGVTTRRGERIDAGLSGTDLFWQAIGFQPATVAETYERRDAIKGAERKLQDRRQGFLRRYASAEPGERGKIWAEVREWNRTQPAEARITFDALRRSLKERTRRAREADAGTYLPSNRRFLMEEGEFANVR